MKPVTQTIIGPEGNCFSACVASILECSIDEVPTLNAFENNEEWVQVLNTWLAGRGLGYMECTVPTEALNTFFSNKDFYHVMIGPTENSMTMYHAVVGRKGKMVFDPHPTVLGILPENILRIGVFVYTGIM